MFMLCIQFPQGVNDSSSSERYNRLWTWLLLSTEFVTPLGLALARDQTLLVLGLTMFWYSLGLTMRTYVTWA